MIPLRDTIQSSRRPVVNYSIIALSAAAFFFQLETASEERDVLVERFGMVPKRVFEPDEPIVLPLRVVDRFGRELVIGERRLADPPLTPWITLLTCIFLHGGWMHFLGNMWFLYIFGDNVEDRFGHLGYIGFYLGSGVAASAAHLFVYPESTIPTIGASGAIAGVMGAYLLLFRHAKVITLIPIFFFIEIVALPAPFFLGIWFLLQFFQGAFALSAMEAAGVAWWAHIGGFAAGMAIVFVLRRAGVLHERPIVHRNARYSKHARRPPYQWR